MLPWRFIPAIAWLCLIGFGLVNSVLSTALVVCRDGHGGVSIEWGCERNSGGGCQTACGGESHDEPVDPHPCQDTPIDGGQHLTKAPPEPSSRIALLVPPAVLLPGSWLETSVRPDSTRRFGAPDRPPDSLRHVRTIVLRV